MFRDHIQKLIEEFSLQEGGSLPKELDSFSLDIEGVSVTLFDRTPGIDYTATLGFLPEENMEESLTHLLRGNFLGQATRKAYLGLDSSGQKVIVNMSIPLIRSYREFHDMLEDFSNVISFWKTEIPLQ
jgi:hypothetical protein